MSSIMSCGMQTTSTMRSDQKTPSSLRWVAVTLIST